MPKAKAETQHFNSEYETIDFLLLIGFDSWNGKQPEFIRRAC
jgi:hypothetical protein